MIPVFLVATVLLANSIGSSFGQSNSNCPIACPAGWVRFGLSATCYKLPAQPAKLDTFWNQDKYCKSIEPTSYPIVVNDLGEQAVGTAVAFQYALNWFAVATNGFIWIGCYTTPQGWKCLDGTDQSKNILMAAAGVIGSQKNFTCLGADPKTLGVWQTRPCDDKTGAVICEMPKRRVCGETGSILPISPISLTPCSLANLFPKMPSIPYVGQLLAGSAVDNALTAMGSKLSSWLGGGSDGECKPGEGSLGSGLINTVGNAGSSALGAVGGLFGLGGDDSGSSGQGKPSEGTGSGAQSCPAGCPKDFFSFTPAPEDSCYHQTHSSAAVSFFTARDRCKQRHPNAYVSVISSFLELSKQIRMSRYLQSLDQRFRQVQHLWLGIIGTDSGWEIMDGSDGGLLLAMASLPPARSGLCVAARFNDLSNWQAIPCTSTTGVAFCEMAKLTACSGLDGTITNLVPVDLTPEQVQTMFPNSPRLPGLGQALGTELLPSVFNPLQAGPNNQANVKCVKGGVGGNYGLFGTTVPPAWIWLKEGDNQISVGGVWIQCKNSISAFRVQGPAYLNVWYRCRLLGYDTAQPANADYDGLHPFEASNRYSEHYRLDGARYKKAAVAVCN